MVGTTGSAGGAASAELTRQSWFGMAGSVVLARHGWLGWVVLDVDLGVEVRDEGSEEDEDALPDPGEEGTLPEGALLLAPFVVIASTHPDGPEPDLPPGLLL